MNWDPWILLAGLGLFLTGMALLEEGIDGLSGKTLKKIIRSYTETPFRSVFTGFITTAILQSSSAVSLILLAFVGSGILSLQNGVGVILGSNIGTTVTSWIVATIGFKIKLESLSMPLIALGGIGYVFFKKNIIITNISRFILGFGMLFYGVGIMKSSVEGLTKNIDIQTISQYGILSFLFFGIFVTAMIHSSLAVMTVALSALNSGLITFSQAASIVIGANIGTTATVLLGSLGGTSEQKQVAYSHFFFNIITGIAIFPLLPVFTYFIFDILHLKNDLLTALASFHSLFNIFGVMLFFPFIKNYALFIKHIAPDKNTKLQKFSIIAKANVPEATMAEFKKHIRNLIVMVMLHNLKILEIEIGLVMGDELTSPLLKDKVQYIKMPNKDLYKDILIYQGELYTFFTEIQKNTLENNAQSKELERYLHSIRNAIFSAKTLKDIRTELENLEDSSNSIFSSSYTNFKQRTLRYLLALDRILNPRVTSLGLLNRNLKLLRKINRDDAEFISHTIDSISGQDMDSEEVSNLLLINRSISMAARQLLFAIKDLELDLQESQIFDERG